MHRIQLGHSSSAAEECEGPACLACMRQSFLHHRALAEVRYLLPLLVALFLVLNHQRQAHRPVEAFVIGRKQDSHERRTVGTGYPSLAAQRGAPCARAEGGLHDRACDGPPRADDGQPDGAFCPLLPPLVLSEFRGSILQLPQREVITVNEDTPLKEAMTYITILELCWLRQS